MIKFANVFLRTDQLDIAIMCPAGQTIATIKGIFTELAAMFPDEELFIGADEVSNNGNCTLSDYAKIESSVCKFITSAEADGGLNRTVGGWEE